MNKDDGRNELNILSKAAVIIRSIDPNTNKKIVLLGKAKHPKLNQTFLTLPAGCFNLEKETPKNAAMRELSEETAGLVYSNETSSPWINEKKLFDITACLSTNDFVEIKPSPIKVKMFNSFSQKNIIVNYYFFELSNQIFSKEMLNFFCTQAKNLLEEKSEYSEIEEYIEVEEDLFFEKIKTMSQIYVDEKWFYSSSSEDDKIKSALSFVLNKNEILDFNKGYFYAMSRLNLEPIKKHFTDN